MFLINIGSKQKEWHTTIFEFEEGCRLLGSWMIHVWWIVMHGNFFLVTWEVAILWDHLKIVNKRKEVCFNWELTVSCQWRYMFQLCIIKISFLSTLHICSCYSKLGADLVVVDNGLKASIISCCECGEKLVLVNLFGWNLFDMEWQGLYTFFDFLVWFRILACNDVI